MFRRIVHTAIVAILMTGPAFVPTAFAQSTPPVEKYELPASVTFPEGIAYDPAANAFYAASAVTGTLVRVNAKTKASEVVAAPGVLIPGGLTQTFPAVLGMKLDSQKRLWIAGGLSAKFSIVDSRSGKVLRELDAPDPAKSLLNDVALIGTTGYVTDTRVPTLWRVEAKGDKIGPLEPWLNFSDTPLQYSEGNNLNGITATPDGKTLIVVQMNKGLLYKIDVKTKTVTPIDTSGADLSGADGLVLDGSTLYVVRQTAVEIATVKLSKDLSQGTVVARFKDPALAWPATAAKVGDRLLVVNSQFNVRGDKKETLPFTVVAVPLSRLAGK
jgi:sugar lactone lactonase YvrE